MKSQKIFITFLLDKFVYIAHVVSLSMDISQYNGGSTLVMKGHKCFAIASDLRFGLQFQTVSCNMEKVFKFNDHLYLGLAGLATDMQTVYQSMLYRYNMYKLNENKLPTPQIFTNIVSNTLYSRRFGPYFIEPIIGGFDRKTGDPYLAACDVIGAIADVEDFAMVGTAHQQILGACECLYKPNMTPLELFETISQCMLNGIDRDAFSGWGVVVYVIEHNNVTKTVLKARMD